jgi:hypothetical protein
MITVHEKMLPVTIKCISQQILFSGSVVEKLPRNYSEAKGRHVTNQEVRTMP